MENKAKVNNDKKNSILESIKDHFSETAEKELGDEIEFDDIAASIVLIVVNGLIGLYFIAHQISSTGFFTSKFGMIEMVLIYGILIYWITTSVLILIGQKNPSRDLDSYGGLFFSTFAIVWLFLVFPFDFMYFADILPVFLRFILQWVSNEIALIILVLLFIVHLIAAIYSLILRLFVRKVRAAS